MSGVAVIPAPVELFGRYTELDDQIVRKILWFDFAAFLSLQTEQRRLVVAHNDAGI